MVVAPVNTLKNWSKEFDKWIPSKFAAPTVFQLSDVGADTSHRYAPAVATSRAVQILAVADWIGA